VDLCRVVCLLWQGYDIASEAIAGNMGGRISVWKAPLVADQILIPVAAHAAAAAGVRYAFGPM